MGDINNAGTPSAGTQKIVGIDPISKDPQKIENKDGVTVAIYKQCSHCGEKDGIDKGECGKNKIQKKFYSCLYCRTKSSLDLKKIRIVVPCGYCGGKGFTITPISAEKPDNKNKQTNPDDKKKGVNKNGG